MKKYVWLSSILIVLLSTTIAFGAWQDTKPAAGDKMSDSQADILGNFQAITGTSGSLPTLELNSASAVDTVDITQDQNSTAIDINKTSTGVGDVITINNDGTGTGILIEQDGVSAASKQALRVESAAVQSTTSLVYFTVSNSGADQILLEIGNVGSGSALYVNQATALDASNYGLTVFSETDQDGSALVHFDQDNASSNKTALDVKSDGTEASITLNNTNGAGAPLFVTPVSASTYSTEGGVYADTEDGIIYYRSSSNWAAMNADTDYSETFGVVGQTSDYEEGDIVVISDEAVTQAKKNTIKDKAKIKVYDGENPQGKPKYKTVHSDRKEIRLLATALKVEKSSASYQTNVLGVISYRSSKNWVSTDEIPVGLLGKVTCKVNNENGFINAGDLLTTSSAPGIAMKATIDSFGKIGSVIGKAREDFNGIYGKIEIIVGVK